MMLENDATEWSKWLDETLRADLQPLFEKQMVDEKRALMAHEEALRARRVRRAAPREPSAAVALLVGIFGGIAAAHWSIVKKQ